MQVKTCHTTSSISLSFTLKRQQLYLLLHGYLPSVYVCHIYFLSGKVATSKGGHFLTITRKVSFTFTTQKMKDCFSKCDQIRNFLQIWSHLQKKSLIETSFFCAVSTELVHFLATIRSSCRWNIHSNCLLNCIYDLSKRIPWLLQKLISSVFLKLNVCTIIVWAVPFCCLPAA